MRGKCKLCLKEADLQESHLLPAAVYKMCRNESEEVADPIGVRNDPKIKSFRVFQSSRQITGQVLCFACEQILNVNGEDWVLPQLSTLQGFPLYDKLTTIEADAVEGDSALYAGVKANHIRTDCLAHFALGIFWKAVVHEWQTGHGTLSLEFGPYREEVRRFLLHGGIPRRVYLKIEIVPPSQPTISAYLPYTSKATPFPTHFFYVPGVEFTLAIGNRVPDYFKEMCIVSNPLKPIFVGAFPAQFIGLQFAEAFEKGRIPTKLAGRLQKGRTERE